jgi:N-acetylmuramic acid 6-phosphate (MurNAc-6-P) etherase
VRASGANSVEYTVTIASITESVNPATAMIDTLNTRMIIAAIQAEDAKGAAAVAAVADALHSLSTLRPSACSAAGA